MAARPAPHQLPEHVCLCCRFTGTVPNDWAKANSFTKLRRLNLANNELSGRLPNFNRRGAWRSLESLDLSSNSFYGTVES